MYRTIDCGTWADPWFADLESDAKLLFLYLFTNPRTTPCGAFEITVRQIEFDTALTSDRIGALLSVLSPKVEWWAELNVVWLRNFYRRQSANSNAETYKKAAKKALETMPGRVKIVIISEYPELRVPLANCKQPTSTLPIPTPEGTDTLPSDTYSFERREEEEKKKRTSSSSDDGFNAFWLAYPKKVAKQDALRAWKRLKPDLAPILEALAVQSKSSRWQEEGGRFIPNPATWLNGGRWEDEISPNGHSPVVQGLPPNPPDDPAEKLNWLKAIDRAEHNEYYGSQGLQRWRDEIAECETALAAHS